MGLNAVVYRNRANLPFDPEQVGAAFDARTGEWYVQDGTSSDFDENIAVALSRRLGNVSAIEGLADEIGRFLRPDSLLQSKVLFNGSHAGDVIEVGYLKQLRDELEKVRRSTDVTQMPVLSEFIRSMEELAEAAAGEGNPIIFT